MRTPRGFREAYRAFVDAGWPALACAPDAGGQGLPQVLNAALYEMLAAANHAWTMYPGLLHGAYECLHAHASPELKARYLGKVVSGEWLSTMCLTEAHAGSDLGLLADPRRAGTPTAASGSSGTKIFISGGEHDLTDNIVHLVLARLPDAPAGHQGHLAVPRAEVPARRHAAMRVRCDGIEKKMGIKGSATCVMAFDGATGWLVGEPNRGLAAMFAMMNAARLHVALQGLAHAENAHQNALRLCARAAAVARGRSAGRVGESRAAPPTRSCCTRRCAAPCCASVCWSKAARLIAYEAAHLIDLAEQSPDAAGASARRIRWRCSRRCSRPFSPTTASRSPSEALAGLRRPRLHARLGRRTMCARQPASR